MVVEWLDDFDAMSGRVLCWATFQERAFEAGDIGAGSRYFEQLVDGDVHYLDQNTRSVSDGYDKAVTNSMDVSMARAYRLARLNHLSS